jgi:Tfp pilus assembly protein PilX
MRPVEINKAQKGFSLYLALMIMIIILSISLGISAIIISQLKIIRGIEDSVIALCAADSGIEQVLYEDRLCRQAECGTTYIDTCIVGCDDGLDAGGSGAKKSILGDVGNINGITVYYKAEFDDGALNISSVGTFNGTKRAVQVERNY